jgi:hypothetical protein
MFISYSNIFIIQYLLNIYKAYYTIQCPLANYTIKGLIIKQGGS